MAAQSKAAGKTTGRDAGILIGALAVIVVGYFLFRDRQEAPQPPTHAGQQMPGAVGGQMGGAMDQLPEDYASLVKLGNQQMDAGNYAMAAECYRRALDIDPSSPSVRTDFGACLHGMGLPERALEEFRIVLGQDGDHLVATFNMGIVFYNQQRVDSATYYFKQVQALDPGSQMAQRAGELIQQMGG